MATPLPYDPRIGAIICDRLASGESLKAICAGDETIPCEATVYRWLRANVAFSEEYARARKDWADAQIERIQEIASDDKRGADHKRLEIDTLKWAMGKLNGKYSDKLRHVGGDEGDAPIRTVTGIEWTVVNP
jgi:hypothetical protein